MGKMDKNTSKLAGQYGIESGEPDDFFKFDLVPDHNEPEPIKAPKVD
jgi:hypothetical protein